jgi:predicted dithiol-disulfide oxidoreductase (DUF899 family)
VRTGTREEWLAERVALLAREKELTRQNHELAAARRRLPWVPVEKAYVFATEAAPRSLKELFDGRSQLLVHHFMHGPNSPAGCTGCSFAADSFDGAVPHLNAHDVTFAMVSRSPMETLLAYKLEWAGICLGYRPRATTSTATSELRPRRTAPAGGDGTSAPRPASTCTNRS